MTAVLIDGRRTPFLKAGSVADVNAVEIGVVPIAALLKKYDGIEKHIDWVVGSNIGNGVLPPGGSNVARIVATQAGVPVEVPAVTVNINCGSGLHAAAYAARLIELGEANLVLVPAVEVMSDYTAVFGREQRALYENMLAASREKNPAKQIARVLRAQTKIWTGGHHPLLKKNFGYEPIWMLVTGLSDPLCGLGMDKIAERLAEEFGISREEQDLFSYESHRKAEAAQRADVFADEIVPFRDIANDNGVRYSQELSKLASLRPLNRGGTVTPGNASQVSDGACALLVASEEFAAAHGLPVLAAFSSKGSATRGCDPARMGIGPVFAIDALLRKTGMTLNDIDLFETNEAFASVVLAQDRILSSKTLCEKFGVRGPIGNIVTDKLNVNGGAIAMGHPVAVSGSRLLLTTALELRRRNVQRGLVALCVGGGQGESLLVERR
jgi:acetyl-CoA acetyltransferase family protein